jgi:hypothetical protein
MRQAPTAAMVRPVWTRLAGVALLTAACAGEQFRAQSYPDANVVILSSAQADDVDCHFRPAPPLGRAFAPLEEEVADAESRLENLDEIFRSCPHGDPTASIRQYVGIKTLWGRYLYIDAYPAALLHELSEFPSWSRGPSSEWAPMCLSHIDEGPDFWGVLYDLEQRAFVKMYVSGTRVSPPGRTCKPAA